MIASRFGYLRTCSSNRLGIDCSISSFLNSTNVPAGRKHLLRIARCSAGRLRVSLDKAFIRASLVKTISPSSLVPILIGCPKSLPSRLLVLRSLVTNLQLGRPFETEWGQAARKIWAQIRRIRVALPILFPIIRIDRIAIKRAADIISSFRYGDYC